MVMGELDKGPRTSTLPPKDEILVVMVHDMAVCLERPTTTPPEEDTVGLKVKYMEVRLEISTNLTCSMLEKLLMVL